jgi:hypothetical protein
MTTPHYSLYGILCDVVVPEGTPEIGSGDYCSVYMTQPDKEDDKYMCVFAFDTEAKLFAHEELVIQIKDAAADANQRRSAAGILTQDISFWIPFLVLV